jgi:hypothetical protein
MEPMTKAEQTDWLAALRQEPSAEKRTRPYEPDPGLSEYLGWQAAAARKANAE